MIEIHDQTIEVSVEQGMRGPKGPVSVSVGTTVTGLPGTSAAVTNSGSADDLILDFAIPRGADGTSAALSVGTVTEGESAAVVNSGTAQNAVLDFTLPRGSSASVSVGTTVTGLPGTSAAVVNSGSAQNAVLDFTIPAGAGIAAGGTTGQMLVKTSAADYATAWAQPPSGIPLVRGTHASVTSAWTGSLPAGVSDYADGLTIRYYIPYTGSANTAVTLNLGDKGAKPVYKMGTLSFGNTYPAKSVLTMTYVVEAGLNSGNGAWCIGDYSIPDADLTPPRFGFITANCSTAAATAEKRINVSNTYNYTQHSIAVFTFTNGNTADSISINLNNKGARTVYFRGATAGLANLIRPGDSVIFDTMANGGFSIIGIVSACDRVISTTDLTEGVSALSDGALWYVYEEDADE